RLTTFANPGLFGRIALVQESSVQLRRSLRVGRSKLALIDWIERAWRGAAESPRLSGEHAGFRARSAMTGAPRFAPQQPYHQFDGTPPPVAGQLDYPGPALREAAWGLDAILAWYLWFQENPEDYRGLQATEES